MLLEINIKEVWKPKNLSYINNKLKIMDSAEKLFQMFLEDITNPQTVATYFLIGLVITFFIEHTIRKAGMDVNYKERFLMMLGWPLTSTIFVVYFIKGFLGKD